MRLKIVFIFLCLSSLAACTDRTLTLIDGERRHLEQFEGQWLLVNYWAAWCKPCVKEIPELNVLNQKKNIKVLAFNYDKPPLAALRELEERFAIKYPSLGEDPAALFGQETVNALPATMVIDPAGQFKTWLMGPQTIDTVMHALKAHD